MLKSSSYEVWYLASKLLHSSFSNLSASHSFSTEIKLGVRWEGILKSALIPYNKVYENNSTSTLIEFLSGNLAKTRKVDIASLNSSVSVFACRSIVAVSPFAAFIA